MSNRLVFVTFSLFYYKTMDTIQMDMLQLKKTLVLIYKTKKK